MGLPLKKQEMKFTYADYRTWPEGERWELINGIAFDMSPAPLRYHQDINLELATIIKIWLKGKPCKVYTAPIDVRLPDRAEEIDDDIDNIVQPDIVVVCDSSKLDEKGVRGAPDWIIEILSPSTAKKDFNEKYNLYEKQGVREYWIIDPNSKTVYQYVRNEHGTFVEKVRLEKKGIAECLVLEGLKINIEEIF